MSEDPARYSLAPNRIFIDGRQVDSTPQSWEPPAPATSHMRTYVNGVEMPFIVRGPEEEEEEALDPGAAQVQADKEAYWRLLDRHYDRSRADYTGQQEDRKLNAKMLAIRRLRNETGRDYLYEWELGQAPAPRLRVPPPVDRTGQRG